MRPVLGAINVTYGGAAISSAAIIAVVNVLLLLY